jgi:poly(A) polymerase
MVTVAEGGRIALSELLEDDSPAMNLAREFNERGHELYVVGGIVRNAGLGEKAREADFATDAAPEETLEIVKPHSEAVWLQGIKFGTVGARISGHDMEITTFRSETYEPGSRHPEVSYETSIETDLSRRDFTINAMAIRLPDKKAFDPFDGLADLNRKLIRTPLDPRTAFTDDPLRMLRAFRFASQLDFKIADDVVETIAELKDELKNISVERIRDEFSRLMIGKAPGRALELADATGITELFLPELSGLKLEQDPVHKHKDVFHHTLAVVERTEPVLVLRLAALLHDIGKPKTRRIDSEGVSFHHHEVEGAKMARERLRALKFPNDVVDAVERIIFLHHRFHTYALGWSDSAVRRYVRDAGPLLGTLNALVRADCTTRNAAKAKRLGERMDELDERIKELAAREELDRIRPDLDGVQVMAYLGVDQGRVVGDALEYLLELRFEEGPLGPDEAYSRLDLWAREQGIEPAGERVPPKEKKRQDG